MATERRKRSGIMLATPATEDLTKRILKEGFAFAQPKLNGERCLCLLSGEKTTLLTSTALEFAFLEKIKEEAREFFFPLLGNAILDGELYLHGMPREEIHSIASRKNSPSVEEDKLQFHVFDIKDFDLPQIKRIQLLKQLNSSEHIKIVKTYSVLSQADITLEQTEAMLQGYEGIVLRAPFAFYEEKRSRFVLKIKPTGVDCYKITGVEEEVSKDGFLKGSLGAFVVEDKEGHTFKVGSGKFLTKASREYLWQWRDSLPGKFLVVKYSKTRNASGIPAFAVAEDLLEEPLPE